MKWRLVAGMAVVLGGCFCGGNGWAAGPDGTPADERKPVAALVASWFSNSHPDVIFGRILRTYAMDGKGEPSKLSLVSLYSDQPGPGDRSAALAAQYRFALSSNVNAALRAGGDALGVDGVLLSTEWAEYPLSDTGQIQYPHRRLFEEVVQTFLQYGRVVPVFIDKHLADNWTDSKWIYDTARAMKIPLMAGSSLPTTWRRPAADVDSRRPVKEIVGISYHTLDCYGFHGLEMVQCLAEQRLGGESGVVAVQCLTNEAVWAAAGTLYDPALLAQALGCINPALAVGTTIQERVPNPVLFVMDYADGLRVNLFTLNYAVTQWAAAWRYKDGKQESQATLFRLQEESPSGQFAFQMRGVEAMVLTGKPQWPVERTLLTSGALHALLLSKRDGGKRLATPYLTIPYESHWRWQQPGEKP